MPETTPLIKAALNLRVGAGFDVYEYTSIEQVHTSCRSWQPDATASLQDVDFSYDNSRKNAYEAVAAGKVKEMRTAMPIL